MKLVIHTQYKENYGAHDWDGKGKCPQYWKDKGGETFVVENLTHVVGLRVDENYNAEMIVDSLRPFIAYTDDHAEEYITNWEIVGDSESVCEDWETPIHLFFNNEVWRATKCYNNRVTVDGYPGYMKSEIFEKRESWVLAPNGGQEHYLSMFLMEDGQIVEYKNLEKWFKAAA
jgi:hypothetical protein